MKIQLSRREQHLISSASLGRFQQSAFNQDISLWNVGSVTDLRYNPYLGQLLSFPLALVTNFLPLLLQVISFT